MITARLLGGRANGWELAVPHSLVYITKVDDIPKCYPENPSEDDGRRLLDRANKQWECYLRIEHLVPDAAGRHGFWCVDPIQFRRRKTDEDVRQAVVDQFAIEQLAELHLVLSRLPGHDQWEEVRRVMAGAGLALRDPPLSVRPVLDSRPPVDSRRRAWFSSTAR
jgi:hypothetical protein